MKTIVIKLDPQRLANADLDSGAALATGKGTGRIADDMERRSDVEAHFQK